MFSSTPLIAPIVPVWRQGGYSSPAALPPGATMKVKRQVTPVRKAQAVGAAEPNHQAAPNRPIAEAQREPVATPTLTTAAGILGAALDGASAENPFVDDSGWLSTTAQSWRGMAAALTGAREHYDDSHNATFPGIIKMERSAIGGIKQATSDVESAAMGLDANAAGASAAGQALATTELTVDTALGVLEEKGYAYRNDKGLLCMEDGARPGAPSAAGKAHARVPGAVSEITIARRKLSQAWARIRRRALNGAARAAASRKRSIEESIAYVDGVLAQVGKAKTFEDSPVSGVRGLLSVKTVLTILTHEEIRQLQARVDALSGHADALDLAADKESFQAALESMISVSHELDLTLDEANPDSVDSMSMDLGPTAIADAGLAHQAAATVLQRLGAEVGVTQDRMGTALSASLHEPARSVLHGPGSPAEGDKEAVDGFSLSLQERRDHHTSQAKVLSRGGR